MAALAVVLAGAVSSAGEIELAGGWVPAGQGAARFDSAVRTADFAADAAQPDRAVQQTSYTSGKSNGNLKWLPAGPSQASLPADLDSPAQTVQFAAPVNAPSAPLADNPLLDPFGDAPSSPGGLAEDPAEAPSTLPPAAQEVLRQIAEPAPLGGRSEEESQRLPAGELERQLAAGPRVVGDECLSLQKLKKIQELSYKIAAEEGQFPAECTLEAGPFQPRAWAPVTYYWKASGLCHKPLYFQEYALERYGHSWGPHLQPFVSGAHFFLTVPILPYGMGLYPPGECMYTLGYYRPGSCAPYLLDPVPLSVRATVFQLGAWTGGMFLIP